MVGSPTLLFLGIVLLLVGVLLIYWASSRNLKDVATGAALGAAWTLLWRRERPGMPEELTSRVTMCELRDALGKIVVTGFAVNHVVDRAASLIGSCCSQLVPYGRWCVLEVVPLLIDGEGCGAFRTRTASRRAAFDRRGDGCRAPCILQGDRSAPSSRVGASFARTWRGHVNQSSVAAHCGLMMPRSNPGPGPILRQCCEFVGATARRICS